MTNEICEICARVCLVDDDPNLRMATAQWLELAGYEVESYPDAPAALARLNVDMNGVVVSDVRMPKMDGMDFLARIKAIDSDLPVVLITAHGDVQMAVEAMRRGAYDFIEKPFEPEQLLEVLQRACEKRRLVMENRQLRRRLNGSANIEQRLIGTSAVMRSLQQQILDVADTTAPVLIVGETGTGKEIVAQCLHGFGARSHGRFVPVHCGAIPEHMVESELFGHERGAFTGAEQKRIGRFEYARGGSLFLDEIGTMPLSAQIKILRALQEREIVRVGSNEAIPIDIRLLSATNCDLQAESRNGTFRTDLYYRLNVIELKVPPLRERKEDILLLFDYFVSLAAENYQRSGAVLTPGDATLLRNHPWPGNVRELRNVAERFVLSSLPLGERLATLLGLGDERFQTFEDHASLQDKMRHYEKWLLEEALRRHKGNIQEILEEFQVPRRTLNEKMTRYGLDRKDFI